MSMAAASSSGGDGRRRLLRRLSKPPSCVSMSQLKQLLAQIIVAGASAHPSSLASLLSFAATSPHGDLRFASLLFAHAPVPAPFAYNSMLRGLVTARLPRRALLLYLQMSRECVDPDRFTFPSVLKACSLLHAASAGEAVHARALQLGFSYDAYVRSGLVRMYSEFDEVAAARQLFDEIPERDVVLWNSMIGGHVKCGDLVSARQLLDEMSNRNVGTYNALLGGYAKFGLLDSASKLFDEMPETDVISWNTMIGAHAKSGDVKVARDLLGRAPQKNAASWSAAISGFAQSGGFIDALDQFKEMLSEGLRPDQAALVSVLSSCAHLGALEQGVWIHGYVSRQGIEVDDLLGGSLIDMYAKCGMLQGAMQVFDRLEKRDVCSWTSMIYAFAMHGRSPEALKTFREMERLEIRPNDVTIIAVLSACSHAGFVGQGRDFFARMHRGYGITPKIEHYTCMVDILSRGNLIEEALGVIKSMPMEPDEFVWGALLGGLRANSRDRMVDEEELWSKIVNLTPKSSGAYVLVANIFASIDRWDDVTRMRRIMEGFGVRKNPGCSLIEVDGIVHEFLASGRLNMRSEELYDMLHQVNRAMKMDYLT